MPALRPLFGAWDLAMYALALVGVAVLWRSSRRALAILALPIALRTVVVSFVVPAAITERYLAEALPLLLIIAAVGLVAVIRHARSLSARLRPAR
jgi:hypothetical protein